MKKPEFIKNIAMSAGVSKKDATKVLDATLEQIISELKEGGSVTFVGFGTFSTVQRAARKARIPNTKEIVDVPAKTAAIFRAGKTLKTAVAENS